MRDIGVRTAMAMEVFFRALTLVSGLAQALIYGLGGWLAVRGEIDLGTVVTLALLLNRLYGPLTALATARLDVVTALVSFERVFEVLDIPPLIVEPERPRPLPEGPVSVEVDDVRFRYPSAGQVSLASLAPRRPRHRRRRARLPALGRRAAAAHDRPPAAGQAPGGDPRRGTAHLGSESEAAVQEALAAALSGRTALVIAHRLSTVRRADAIIVVEDGRVAERGTHAELLALGGRYADLHRTQFADGAAVALEAAAPAP